MFFVNQKHAFEILQMLFDCQNLKVNKIQLTQCEKADFELNSFLSQVDAFVEKNQAFVTLQSGEYSVPENEQSISKYLNQE